MTIKETTLETVKDIIRFYNNKIKRYKKKGIDVGSIKKLEGDKSCYIGGVLTLYSELTGDYIEVIEVMEETLEDYVHN